MGDVVLRVNNEHQSHVDDGEHAVEGHTQEVDGTGGLAVTEQAHGSRKRPQKAGLIIRPVAIISGATMNTTVKYIICCRASWGWKCSIGRDMQASVNLDGLPSLGNDVPAGGDDAAPLTGQEQQAHVNQAVSNPDEGDQGVPCAAQTTLALAGQRDEWRQGTRSSRA